MVSVMYSALSGPITKSLQTLLSPGRFQRIFAAPVVRSKLRSAVCRAGGVVFGTGVSWHVHSVFVDASASMPKKNVPGASVLLTSINFSAVAEPGRTLYTNGELALPTMSTPPGATVRLSGCDFASPIKISAANTVSAKPAIKVTQKERRRMFAMCIVNLPAVDVRSSQAVVDVGHLGSSIAKTLLEWIRSVYGMIRRCP